MAPTIYNYSEIDLERISIRERDMCIRYDEKPLYVQTPLLKVRKFKSEEKVQVKAKELEWTNFLVDLESRIKFLYHELTDVKDFKRLRNLVLTVTPKTQIKSANLVDLSLLDLKDASFVAIMSIDKLLVGDSSTSVNYNLFTVKTSTSVFEKDEDPCFTVDDLKE